MISVLYVESTFVKFPGVWNSSSSYCSEMFSQNKTKSNSSISQILMFTGKLPVGITLNLKSLCTNLTNSNKLSKKWKIASLNSLTSSLSLLIDILWFSFINSSAKGSLVKSLFIFNRFFIFSCIRVGQNGKIFSKFSWAFFSNTLANGLSNFCLYSIV